MRLNPSYKEAELKIWKKCSIDKSVNKLFGRSFIINEVYNYSLAHYCNDRSNSIWM